MWPRLVQFWRGLSAGTRAAWLTATVLFVAAVAAYTTGVQLERDDAFCASCHVEPETTYYQQSLTPQAASTLAAFHAGQETRCIDCHSGRWIPGRVRAQWIGLHNLLAFRSGNYHQPTQTTRPPGDSSCTKCHSDLTWASQRPGHYHSPQLRRRWQAFDGLANTCQACHPSHEIITTAGFQDKTEVETQCDACHELVGRRP